jgi:hypothetical protein
MLKERNWKTGQLHQTTSSGFRTQKLQKKKWNRFLHESGS